MELEIRLNKINFKFIKKLICLVLTILMLGSTFACPINVLASDNYDSNANSISPRLNFIGSGGDVSDGNIVDITEYKDISLDMVESVEVEAYETVYFRFIPSKSGRYIFESDSDNDTYGYLYNFEGKELTTDDDSGDDLNFEIIYDLYVGESYFFGARFYNKEKTGVINVKLSCIEIFCEHKNTIHHNETEGNCAVPGYTEGTYCDDCESWLEGHNIIYVDHIDENNDKICDACEGGATVTDGNIGENIKWGLFADGELVIDGSGDMEGEGSVVSDNLKGSVKSVVVKDGVTSIRDEAFRKYSNLENVELSDSVKRIGDRAFSGCTKLDNINVPDSVTDIGEAALLKSISFVPKTHAEFTIGVSDGWERGDDWYFGFYGYEKGDKLIVNHLDGKSIEFLYDGDENFVSDEGISIYRYDVDLNDTQDEYPWVLGGEHNYYTVTYFDVSCMVPVTILENPVVSINFTHARPFEFIENISSGYYDEYYDYYKYNIGFREGDTLTVKYSNGNEVIYTYIDDDSGETKFRSSDGEIISGVKITDDQSRDNPWRIGKHNVTVSYANRKDVFDVEIKECTVKEISATYKNNLYNNYDCVLGEWSSDRYIIEEYITCAISMTDGTTITGTVEEIEEIFNNSIYWSVDLDDIGENRGYISIGAFSGGLIVNVEDEPDDINVQPGCKFKGFAYNFVEGQMVDCQIIEFEDMDKVRHIEIFDIPEGLSLNNDGRLTGKVEHEGLYLPLRFNVYWEESYAHSYCDFEIHVVDSGNKVAIPDEVDTIPFDTPIYVNASQNSPKWFKFRACDYDMVISYIGPMSIFDTNGTPIECDGLGDGPAMGVSGVYNLLIGEYYYIKVEEERYVYVKSSSWTPALRGDETTIGGEISDELYEVDVKKIIEGESNNIWNVYYYEGIFDVDYSESYVTDKFGTMLSVASPVNVYLFSEVVDCSSEIISERSYIFDPNDEEDCYRVGASTEQLTMKDELLEGEREYRLDNVYRLMPEFGDFYLKTKNLLYVPSGYVLKDSHVVKVCENHEKTITTKENIVEPTCENNGSYDAVDKCEKCGVEVSREKVITAHIDHMFEDGICTMCGKNISELNEKVNLEEAFDINFENGMLSVTGSGEIPSFDEITDYPWSKYASSTTELLLNGVTSVGANAFSNFKNLKLIIVDGDKTVIDANAFDNCPNIELVATYADLDLDDETLLNNKVKFFNKATKTVNRNSNNFSFGSKVAQVSGETSLTEEEFMYLVAILYYGFEEDFQKIKFEKLIAEDFTIYKYRKLDPFLYNETNAVENGEVSILVEIDEEAYIEFSIREFCDRMVESGEDAEIIFKIATADEDVSFGQSFIDTFAVVFAALKKAIEKVVEAIVNQWFNH